MDKWISSEKKFENIVVIPQLYIHNNWGDVNKTHTLLNLSLTLRGLEFQKFLTNP